MPDPFGALHRFLVELRRRRVYQVAAAYLMGAFVVVQIADLAAGAFDLPPWVEPFVWVLSGLGLPLALVLAWAYDLGPSGLRPATADEGGEPADHVEAERTVSPGYRRFALLAVGLVVVGAAGAWYVAGGTPTEITDRSIAVLPFTTTGGEESLRFGQGLYDGLLTRLTNLAALTVKSRTSSDRYEASELTIPEIAREMDVAWIVEGSVHRAADRIRVNATLIDARADDRRWAQDYDRAVTVENVFEIQTDLARRIASSLQAEMSPREEARLRRRPTDDLEAYRLYLEGRVHLDRRTEVGFRRAVELFDGAIERDPAYALAWSGLADARSLQATFGYGPPDSLRQAAFEAAREALRLDPDLAEAHASLGLLYDDHFHDLPSGLREMTRAVELKPSYAQAHQWLGEMEGGRGRQQEALSHLRRAAELDPGSAVIQLVLGWTHWWVEGPDSVALDHVRRARELEPSLAVTHVDEGLILSDAGRHEEALAALERGRSLSSPGSFTAGLALGALGVARAAAGDPAASRQHLQSLRERGQAPLWEAMIHAALGEEDAAFAALDRVEWTAVLRWDLLVLPSFDSLRDDPRYQRLLADVYRQWGLEPDGSEPAP